MPRAIVVSNGVISDYSFYKFKEDDFVICADGGIKHLLRLNHIPDVWIGDFDSCRFSDLIRENPKLSEVSVTQLNPDKDVTDTHYACMLAIEMGYTDIVIWGACGGRIDHMLSNIHLLQLIKENGANAVIEDEKNTVHLCDGCIALSKKRKYLSVIPMSNSIVIKKTEGLLYPLENYTLTRSVSMGVSNEIVAAEATLVLDSGLALIIESDD